jgi:hypothetical protein
VTGLLDAKTLKEIDEAGRCLACTLYTASGFHILRSVEMAVKAYVFMQNGGNLPKLNQRSWGKYIELLTGKVSEKVLDALRILKGKRNPLMHPQHVLNESQAVSLFCICGAAMEALVEDVNSKNLAANFKDAFDGVANLEDAEFVP